MNFTSLAIISCVGLCLLAFGNQLVLTISAKDREPIAATCGKGPLASVIYAARNPRKCALGILVMVLGLLLLLASSIIPVFSYQAN